MIADVVAVVGAFDGQVGANEKLGGELSDGAFSLTGMEAGNSMLCIEFLGVFVARKLLSWSPDADTPYFLVQGSRRIGYDGKGSGLTSHRLQQSLSGGFKDSNDV